MKEMIDLKFKEMCVRRLELRKILNEIRDSKHSSDKLVVGCIVCEIEVGMTLYTSELNEEMMTDRVGGKDRTLYYIHLEQESLKLSNYIEQLEEYLKLDVWQRNLSSFQAVKEYYDKMKIECPEAYDEAMQGLVNDNGAIKFFLKMNKKS